ncbi:unnamed protein product [Nezara viridula]|uniref:Major facilitator superfamily (MFS) profile domain-containing protein n=1 Tax=Nezara viridula TaxID=85310 RepID=A0A9P0HAV8_NEZVI|nr:unnamed protein product [Nezara viridula]
MVFKVHQKCVPQRVFVCMMSFIGLTIMYMMRFSLSLTLTFIALPKRSKKSVEGSCVKPSTKNETSEHREVLFEWDEGMQGQLLGAFFYGYVLTQLPAGIISDLFGPRRVVFWSGFLTSLVTIIVGPVTNLLDWTGLFIIRILTGLFQGAFYASLHAVVAIWVPKNERGRLGTFVFVASVLPSIGLLGVSYCECNGTCAFVSLIVGMGAMGTFYPSLKVNGIDLSTNYGGTVGSTSHWLGTTAGALGPPLIAALAPDYALVYPVELTDTILIFRENRLVQQEEVNSTEVEPPDYEDFLNSTIAQYRVVMWLSFVLMTVTNIFYLLFASANVQKFNNYQPKPRA